MVITFRWVNARGPEKCPGPCRTASTRVGVCICVHTCGCVCTHVWVCASVLPRICQVVCAFSGHKCTWPGCPALPCPAPTQRLGAPGRPGTPSRPRRGIASPVAIRRGGPRSQASLQKAQGPGVCKLPKPPASRALCQTKRAPRAAFPSACLAAQTKRWAEGTHPHPGLHTPPTQHHLGMSQTRHTPPPPPPPRPTACVPVPRPFAFPQEHNWVPSAQRLVWAAKQALGKAALGALFA